MLHHFDGSGRQPRAVQRQGLEWLQSGWVDSPVHAIEMTVGSGKSAFARTLQIGKGAHTVIPSNLLMDQYTNEYTKVNFLKGKAHYSCQMGMTCHDWTNVMEQRACNDCPYKKQKEIAETCPTFFNPMSLYYLLRQRQSLHIPAIVVDEAHQLPQMVLQLCSIRLRKSAYGFTDHDVRESNLYEYLKKLYGKLSRLAFLYQQGNAHKKAAECASEMESIAIILEAWKESPQNFAVYLEKGLYHKRPETYLNIRPIRAPAFVMRELLRSERVVLMSGTLFPHDLEDLSAGRSHRFLSLPSPIPKERRQILYRPTPFPMNSETPPAKVVEWIEQQLKAYPNRNTIIHTTYDRAKKWAPLFNQPILINTPETKNETLERFKKYGGVWLAAGCAEGLDLRDDLCRLNIVPHLMRANLGDPVIAKRKGLQDGNRWYALEAIKIAIQQFGRSTRHENDESISIMGDPTFSRLVMQYRPYIPESFYEAIQWTS